ncbi:MAG: DUF4824 family protein [Burkholderiales bacterium]
MERWRRWGTGAGVALILATNAIVLGGVAYNRSGVPESTLRLTQRELAPPYEWGMASENSGLSLRIDERVAAARSIPPSPGTEIAAEEWYAGRGEPNWLDDAKLATLGIDAKAMRARYGARRGGAPMAKEVLFVLELDGPAYAESLARARRIADEEAATAAANPGNERLAVRAKNAAQNARLEEQERTRLFVVDAGLDRDALRVQYPDRQRYAIARGILRPFDAPAGKPAVWVDRLSVGDVNVPYAFRQPLGALIDADRMRGRQRTPSPFEASVAWGQRLEPWIVVAKVR